MRQATIFEAQNLIGSRLGKGVAQNIGIAGHRLRLRDNAHAGIVKTQAMVHVFAGDVEIDRFSDGENIRRDAPAPLFADRSGAKLRRRSEGGAV